MLLYIFFPKPKNAQILPLMNFIATSIRGMRLNLKTITGSVLCSELFFFFRYNLDTKSLSTT